MIACQVYEIPRCQMHISRTPYNPCSRLVVLSSLIYSQACLELCVFHDATHEEGVGRALVYRMPARIRALGIDKATHIPQIEEYVMDLFVALGTCNKFITWPFALDIHRLISRGMLY
jgi:hypothetical protein